MITRTRTKWKPQGIIFATAPQTREWAEVEEHLRLLPDAGEITLVRGSDGVIEGITFSRQGLSYAIMNSFAWVPKDKAEFWFYLWDKKESETALQEVVKHFETMLS